MASPTIRNDLKALHRLINQSDLVLATILDPHPSIHSARESLAAALALSKDLTIRASADPATVSAAELGAKGGSVTAKRGSDYFKRIAAMRKTRSGGRSKSSNDN